MFNTSVLIPLLTFFIGLLGGHYFALIRDKRKEHNEACLPLYESLRRAVLTNDPKDYPHFLQLEVFADHVNFCKKRAYKKAVKNLLDSCCEDAKARMFNQELTDLKTRDGYLSQSQKYAEELLVYFSRK